MVPHFLGQNPDEVDALASGFEEKASTIEQLIASLDGAFDSTTWVGTDRTRFEGNWVAQITPELKAVASSLKDAAQVARDNAREQRENSF
jgi:uncharacterized protein YukE